MTKENPFRYFKTSREVIQLAVMLEPLPDSRTVTSEF
jgi:hypothetical protein